MIKRRKTRTVTVGSVKLGSNHPIVIQSMTKVPTTNVAACVRQIEQLVAAGCGIVRLAVPTQADTVAFAKIVRRVSVPLVADIHFSPDRAIEAIEGGASKIRLNPGNIKSRPDILRIIDCAKAHRIAIRIGVNEASIRDLKKGDVPLPQRVKLMLKELRGYVNLFEKRGFGNIVLSAKSADTVRTIEVNRAISAAFDYPLHLGLTHAGLPEDAQTPSAVALGSLLSEGIGDTIRVSAAGNPVVEAMMGREILQSLELVPRQTVELIVCPTCGRTKIDVVALARRIKKALATFDKPARVAVMGCIVNGPGEAADADLAVCAAAGKGFIYRRGEKVATVSEKQLVSAMLAEVAKL
jgi:(E)-4-hydroxy-3-methylbut-2-enyl-diphosphate synthase